MQNWYCCPEWYCAATAADCAFQDKRTELVRLAAIKQCGPDETSCPSGCCPEPHWFCCGWPEDDIYCAATADDCPFQDKRTELVRVAAIKQCVGTECPGGCCPEVG